MVDEAAATFRDGLQEILTEYPTPEHIGEGTDFETAHGDHPMYQLVVNRVGEAVNDLIDTDTYNSKASVGRGTPTYIPYVAILHNDETDSPQSGRYVVYLFDPIERTLYLTLNQGAAEATELASESDDSPVDILERRAERMEKHVTDSRFQCGRLSFAPPGRKSKLYGAGTVCYKAYQLDAFPDAETIVADLNALLDIYEQVIAEPLSDDDSTESSIDDFLDDDGYDSITAATDDISERLTQRGVSNWMPEELTTTILTDWSEVLTNFQPDTVVSPTDEIRLEQIRRLYDDTESRLQDDVETLGSGTLNHLSAPETLFVVYLRLLQDDAGLTTNVNQVKGKLILNQEYEIATEDDDQQPAELDDVSHPLLSHLESLDPDRPVWTFTGPPDYWLTAIQHGTVSFEAHQEDAWQATQPGDVVFLYSQAESNVADVPAQSGGIFAVGILGEKARKDEPWWLDETAANPFDQLTNFKRLFVTSDLDRLDLATAASEHTSTELVTQLDALTGDILTFDRVNDICTETNGVSFQAQGAHKRFRDASGDMDHERPKALLAALADRLQEVGTVDPYLEFTGELTADTLDGLFFPGDEATDIIEQIEAALRTGKHIILTGPPGTGKTEIARQVCAVLATEYPYLYSDFQLTTATADWSTFDTVGGYMPEAADEGADSLSFTPGIVLNRLKDSKTGRQRNEPIIIDELNRADIDKAFGQLFTLLSGQSVQLPYTRDREEVELLNADQTNHRPKPHQFVVPESWRIFATMNTYDKTSLYEMSYAFMRRFAFIRVGAPDLPSDDEALLALMQEYTAPAVWDIAVDDTELAHVGRVWRAMNQAVTDRAIGPAIVQDIVSYVAEQRHLPVDQRITRAIISYIFPQLEGVPKREQILRRIAAVDAVDTAELNTAAAEMLQVSLDAGDDS